MKGVLISAAGSIATVLLLTFSAVPAVADGARDHASAARDSARDRGSAARDRASAARDHANAARDSARDQASAARDQASADRDQASADRDSARGVFVSRNGDRSYTSFQAWIEDLGWATSTDSVQPDSEVSAQTSVAVGNAVSTQRATSSSSSGKASINLSTTVHGTEDGRSVTQTQRADANASVD
jgi:hypothetical protein